MIISGSSTSRLSELRKYTITNVFTQQYWGGVTFNNNSDDNGVDFTQSTPGVRIVYYLNGIKYIDSINAGVTTTTFSLTPNNTGNFIDTNIYQNPNKENIVSNPKIYDDVFIIRQELSAFDKNFRLQYMSSLIDVVTYAGGNFFNIVNNT